MGLHVIRYPSGRYGFTGKVPASLAYRGTPEDVQVAVQHGAGIAAKIAKNQGREFTSLSWDSKDAAVAEATAQGFEVIKD